MQRSLIQRPAVLFLLAAASTIALAQDALLPENAVKRVSEHVYAIVGFPDIGFVVGNRATLVVDTGLGVRNGALVAREAAKLGKDQILYLTTTHFHPEHVAGEQAFPAKTVIIRPRVQQEEMDQVGVATIERFKTLSPQFKELIEEGAKIRQPDIVFDSDLNLDLGGVTARLFWLGAAHTKGDELIWVEQDRALLTGDIVQDLRVPSMPANSDGTVKRWLEILDKLQAMNPRFVVPNHGPLGDGSMIGRERAFILDMRARAGALKRQGVPVEEAAQMLTAQFKAQHPDWDSPGGVANVVRRMYSANP